MFKTNSIAKTMTNKLVTECFLIKTSLYAETLWAYLLETNQAYAHAKIGRQLVFQLRKQHPEAQWVYCEQTKRLISNQMFSDEILKEDCLIVWQQEQNTFESLRSLHQDFAQEVQETEKACFIVMQIEQNKTLAHQIQQLLLNAPLRKDEPNLLQIKRKVQFKFQSMCYQDKTFPLLQISLHSEIDYLDKPSVFAQRYGLAALKGLYVENRFQPSSTKSVIKKVSSLTLQTERQAMCAKSKNERMKKYLMTASESEPIVQVAYKSRPQFLYDYALDALRLKPQFKDLERYVSNASQIRQKFFIGPQERMRLILSIAELLHTHYPCLLCSPVSERPEHPLFFRIPQPIYGQIGQEQTIDLNKNYFDALSRYGCYTTLPEAKKGTVRTVILASGEFSKPILKKIKELLLPFGIQLESLPNLRLTYFDENNHEQLTSILQHCITEKVDLILAFIHPKKNPASFQEEDDEVYSALSEDCYNLLKRLTIQNGIASQVINLGNSHNQYILHNTVLGILAKLGHVPYVLRQPLEFIDCIVGLDIGREEKERTKGSMSTVVATRIFSNNGLFLDYTIENIAIEGETISEQVLKQFFNTKFFQNKKVLIHRDGRFRGDEKKSLQKIAAQLNAQFNFVEVVKANLTGMTHPRLYEQDQNKKTYKNPPRGVGLYLDQNRAILVTTAPINNHVTARSLLIEKEGSCSLEEAIRSVMMMTYLHYGSIRAPRLPVTLFASDKIAGMALKRILPSQKNGQIQYWL